MVDAILDTARAVMREQGVAALNLQEVARRLGMRAPSLYEYFPAKLAIYDALYRLGVQLYLDRLEHLEGEHASFLARVRAIFETYMTFALDHPDLYQLVFERPVPGFVPSEEGMQDSRQLLAFGNRLFEAAIAAGEIDPGLPMAQARDLVVAVAHGLASRHLANEPRLPVGSGRFGSLIPAAVALFEATWGVDQPRT